MASAADGRKPVEQLITRAGGAVLIIGINQLTELYLRSVADSPTGRVEIAGILSSRSRHWGRLFRSHRVLGRPEELERVIHDLAVHGVLITRIVLALPLEQLSAASQAALLQAHSTFDVGVEKLSERFGTNCQAAVLNTPADDNAVRVLFDREVGLSTYFKWKRLLDLSAALLCILCLAPIMLLVAVVVLLDVGYPVIFWQQRPGILGRPIKVLKFRTMRAARDQQGQRFADEERLSAIGRFLRLVRLDELPQIYNVLIGEMSFVGPRPLLPKDQSPGAVARLCIRPGLTGWAQIHGGRHLSMHDKAALDLWYVKNASFALDFAILVSTFRILLFGERVDLGAIRTAWRELGCEPPDVVETSRTGGARAC
jgi:lipopolysaccharide/colanic/teichoic acid biosynthesis glycosyltransferase